MNIKKMEYEEIKKRLDKAENKAAVLDELVAIIIRSLKPELENIAQRAAEEVFFRETVSI